ncbi:Ectomycorrhiza-regulated small secreted protein [Mycena indigotica]|uniref:Ectomycorrhiza-regulated small secreted protein n=1 Tax=Mycena indigotica TaxID=2126181 RepID=A0A8H6SI50_9AGAR|nr:Ectomycorrhiza-regulated small secreted protein [Mycena indigotica]KAF7299363.1 Ectomycorrhiza-regulated small secreted protein [Mycena indigotica]
MLLRAEAGIVHIKGLCSNPRHSLFASRMDTPTLNPLLRYFNAPRETSTCPVIWDLRKAPKTAHHVHTIGEHCRPLSDSELSQHATHPPVATLRVRCGVYPSETWVSEARNRQGVTVKNVLDAIYRTLNIQLTHAEWESLCPKQQNRVNLVFDARWRAGRDPKAERAVGILRRDCLLQHVLFAGLSETDEENDYMMTVGRTK